MPKVKKPAPKGGKKKAAPKKAIKRAIKKAEKAIAEGRVLTERQADQLAADKMRADSFASTQPKHPTVEEQWENNRVVLVPSPPAPKRTLWSRFRSAITGLFVSKKYAEANPDTTVRERVKP